jgi:hypothetical protein
MTTPPCSKSANPALPKYHFAILFEGAWIFTPEANGHRILATCPLDDDMHESEFGIWNNAARDLDPVDGFDDIDVQCKTAFTVNIDPSQIVKPADHFSSLFSSAAVQYPFVYLPASDPSRHGEEKRILKLRKSAIANGRTVSIPIPSSLRTAGALLTAEVGGNGKPDLFGQEVTVKRAFVTFLFLYEYHGSLKAEVCRKHKEEKSHCGHVIAEEGGSNPTPHLIYKVYPTAEGMAAMTSCGHMGHEVRQGSGTPDQSAEKVHATTTFDFLRQSITICGTGTPTGCCDIALYPDQNDMRFDCGDVGLSEFELGLALNNTAVRATSTKHLRNTRLPSCASGGISGDTDGTSD